MAAFSAMDIGRTGIGFSRHWLDTVAHNLANVNTVNGPDEEPFRARFLVAQPNGGQLAPTGSGVHLDAVVEAAGDAPQSYEPGHPLADENGYVTRPMVDLAGQLADLMLAQRTHQANVRTIQTAREAYEATLQIGRG